MNILHLVDNLYIYSGISHHILILSKIKTSKNFVISIRENRIKKIFNYHNVQTFSNKLFSNPIFAIILLIYFVKKNDIRIIHVHHRYFDFIANIIKYILDIKVIATVHSIVYGKKIFSYKADKIIAVSNSVKQHLISYFHIDEKRISVITNAIDPNRISISSNEIEIKKELSIDNTKHIVGFVGRFDINEKGIDLLLAAAKKIIQNNSDVIFIFIGDGVDKAYLKENTKIHPENFLIIDSRPNIFDYMQIFDQMVLPSRVDPFPFVMLEAAYLKIPFIGSNVDGISEFVEDEVDGLLFQSENSEELEQKIIKLKNNPDFGYKLVDKAYKKILNNYTTDQKVNEYYRIYEKLLGNVDN